MNMAEPVLSAVEIAEEAYQAVIARVLRDHVRPSIPSPQTDSPIAAIHWRIRTRYVYVQDPCVIAVLTQD